jgi:hypothetical protein
MSSKCIDDGSDYFEDYINEKVSNVITKPSQILIEALRCCNGCIIAFFTFTNDKKYKKLAIWHISHIKSPLSSNFTYNLDIQSAIYTSDKEENIDIIGLGYSIDKMLDMNVTMRLQEMENQNSINIMTIISTTRSKLMKWEYAIDGDISNNFYVNDSKKIVKGKGISSNIDRTKIFISLNEYNEIETISKCICISNDGSKISLYDGSNIILFNDNLKKIRVIKIGEKDNISFIKFINDNVIVSVSENGIIKAWDIDLNSNIFNYNVFNSNINPSRNNDSYCVCIFHFYFKNDIDKNIKFNSILNKDIVTLVIGCRDGNIRIIEADFQTDEAKEVHRLDLMRITRFNNNDTCNNDNLNRAGYDNISNSNINNSNNNNNNNNNVQVTTVSIPISICTIFSKDVSKSLCIVTNTNIVTICIKVLHININIIYVLLLI